MAQSAFHRFLLAVLFSGLACGVDVDRALATDDAPSHAKGIFVSAHGDNQGDGTRRSPLRSINLAIARAKATGLDTVYLLGNGTLTGLYSETVFLESGIHIIGSVCTNTDDDAISIDTERCKATITGSSPAVVALELTEPTRIEHVDIVAHPGAGEGELPRFLLPGLGCAGRGHLPDSHRALECVEEVSEERVANNSVAVFVDGVTNATPELLLRHVHVRANDAGPGLDGAPGNDGASGATGSVGLNAGKEPWATPLVPGAKTSACSTSGAAGGIGGRFHWDGTLKRVQLTDAFGQPTGSWTIVRSGVEGRAYAGGAGESTDYGAGGSGAKFEVFERGADGVAGGNGAVGAPGRAGDGGSGLDALTLNGASGATGTGGDSGDSGGGGGGGAPAIRTLYVAHRVNGTWTWSVEGTAGSVTGTTTTGASTAQMTHRGETAAGSGGYGGYGGCGGESGQGGRGGGSSIGVFVTRARVAISDSSIATGQGGDGGRGAAGGRGGAGGFGGAGGQGHVTLPDSFAGMWIQKIVDSAHYGMWIPTQVAAGTSSSIVEIRGASASQGGYGGAGGKGGAGGEGGSGGGGAGGAAVGVMLGSEAHSVIDTSVTFDIGDAGTGGASPDEGSSGAPGLRAQTHTL